jgi:hypothetical protein
VGSDEVKLFEDSEQVNDDGINVQHFEQSHDGDTWHPVHHVLTNANDSTT